LATVSIHQDLLLHILYGSPDGRRFTQDTPVLPEVWLQFARDIGKPVSGLIVPRYNHQAHDVAEELHQRIRKFRVSRKAAGIQERGGAQIADMPGLICMHCHFDEVINVVLPLTRWWATEGMEALVELPEKRIASYAREAFEHLRHLEDVKKSSSILESQTGFGNLGQFFHVSEGTDNGTRDKTRPFPDSTARILLVLSLIHAVNSDHLKGLSDQTLVQGQTHEILNIEHLSEIPSDVIGKALCDILQVTYLRKRRAPQSEHYQLQSGDAGEEREKGIGRTAKDTFDPRLIFTFSINRDGDGAVLDSVKTTKADAARRLFDLSSKDVTWAVIDSGIDATHHAFRKYPADHDFAVQGPLRPLEVAVSQDDTRVIARYDMTLISELRNRDSLYEAANREDLAQRILLDATASRAQEKRLLTLLENACEDLRKRRPLNWDLVEQIARVPHERPPQHHHGTHVAGTLGGRWPEAQGDKTVWIEGMCADIKLIDFNVVGGSLKATEFAVIAAMRLIRHLNERSDFMVIHGANLSLAIPHDVTNYACGRTPVCVECETLINNGVVVIAAAGNAGYNVFKTGARDVPLHTETSIADPGNTDAVITVGSTHRLEPHNYGVSYFSSRGPTGDGRVKPDLVAPGEKIDGPICDQQFATLEGTSMAAPHVSGAAALLMARFPELVGNPKRIKQILCDSATDLGRERNYQGRGLVDVLRAMQSV